MALTVGGDTYISMAEFDAYLGVRFGSQEILALSEPVKEILLKSAVRAQDLYCDWKGRKTNSDQLLEFPRDNEDTPQNIKNAQCEIAISIYEANSTTSELEPQLKEMKVDVLTFKFNTLQNATSSIFSSLTKSMLRKYCKCQELTRV